jgi:hypothetical protein
MPLWTAALSCTACVGGTVFFLAMYRKNKKAGYIVFTVLAALLGLALFAYAGLALVLLGNRD